MKIGIAATRLAGVDGVTFETAKWEAVLESLGHELRLCAGEVDALRRQARLVPPMHFTWGPAERVTTAAFDPDSDPEAVRAEIDRLADLLLPVLHDWAEVNALEDVSERLRAEIEHFWTILGEDVEIEGWKDRDAALEVLDETRRAFREG